MKGSNFKKACLVFTVTILSHWAAFTQIPYFVYLQSENNQAFSVQVNQKKYASSNVGHCIIPELTSGSYKIEVTLEGAETPQDYQLDIKENDEGYLIKGMNGGTDYALLNMKTGALQYSGAEKLKALEAAKAKQKEEEEKAKAAENARLEKEASIAAAAKQEAEAKEALVKKEREDSLQRIQAETTPIIPQKDSLTIKEAPEKQKEVVQPAKETMQVIEEEAATEKTLKEKQEAEIRKYNEERRLALEKEKDEKKVEATGEKAPKNTTSPQGTLSMAEIVRLQEEARRIDAQGKRDSILKAKEQTPVKKEKSAFLDMDFTMPAPEKDTAKKEGEIQKPKLNTETETSASETMKVEKTDSATIIKTEPAPSKLPETNKPEVPVKGETVPVKETTSSKNENCKSTASSEEIDLITMMIKAEKNGEEAIDLIRKITRLKCVTTQQVRTMAGAFPGEEERYRVLDLCYRFTLDQDAYPSLVNLLSDIYYINRFKALLR